MSYADCDVIAKLVPAGPHVTLDDALRISRELREKYEGDEQVKKLIDTARALEGMPRHASTHAAGVVITKRPVVDYVPLARNDDTIVCQYVMTTLEELGCSKWTSLACATSRFWMTQSRRSVKRIKTLLLPVFLKMTPRPTKCWPRGGRRASSSSNRAA